MDEILKACARLIEAPARSAVLALDSWIVFCLEKTAMSSSTLRAQEFTSQLQYVEKLIGEKRLPDAARMLNTLAKTAPNDPRLFLLGSLLAEAANNQEGMLTAAKKAVELAPGWPVATLRLAGVYAAQEQARLPSFYESPGPAQLAVQTAEQAIFEATHDNSLSTDLLTRATVIALKCKQYPQALLWAEQASNMAPESAHLKHLLGEALAYNGQADEAIKIYSQLLENEPNNQAVLLDRAMAHINSGQTSLAQQDGQRLLTLDPSNETYLFYSTLAQDKTPTTLPASVVTRIFNDYAPAFDQHLVGALKYTLPQDVAKLITSWHPDKKVDVLDLGCGTGLLGLFLGQVDGVIVGVDLSGEMIEKAYLHNVYAQFNQVNVLDALKATGESQYDVITALDVLIYVGDLTTVIPNAHRILTLGGRFVFSCESASPDVKTFALESTQRYVHQQDHVHQLLVSAGFKDIIIERRTLRFEAGEPVAGFLVTAQK
jgi:predicted TPR repeat methyltransferase